MTTRRRLLLGLLAGLIAIGLGAWILWPLPSGDGMGVFIVHESYWHMFRRLTRL